MSVHRESVAASRLFAAFDPLAGFEKVTSAEVAQLKALVLDIAESVGPHLDWIQFTFVQYTKHDLQHLLNISDHICDFLPTALPGRFEFPVNALELAYLWLAILLHDIGMFVSSAGEKQKILDAEQYQDYLRHCRDREKDAAQAELQGHVVTAQAIRDAIFAEFIRRQHAERVHGYIKKHLAHKLRFRQADLSQDVGKLCESHNWGVFQSRDSRHHEKCLAQLPHRDLVGTTPVNLAYLACCLRLGDILDFDRSRTPLSAFHSIHFSEHVSVEEWKKHLSIRGLDINEYRAHYVAECEDPADYVSVQHFLDWVDRELQDSTRLVQEFSGREAERYRLNLAPVVDRTQVRMQNPNYVAGGFRFQLEYAQIMRLLMDKSLYPDETLFLRELLQNALDACRFQQARAEEAGLSDKYIPRIQVWDGSDLPYDKNNPLEGPRIIFQDNGVGMSLKQVEHFFMRVGKSYYRSAEFLAERERLEKKGIYLDACSQFGIGFLSCFLGGDLIEVETSQHHCEPLKITIKGPRKYFVIERLPMPSDAGISFNSPADPTLDSPPRYAGTRITVHLRDGWRKNSSNIDTNLVCRTLNAVAVNQDFVLTVRSLRDGSLNTITNRRWDNLSPEFPGWHAGIGCSIQLSPSLFRLEHLQDSIRGTGALWLLNDAGSLVPRTGDLFIDGQGVIRLHPFVDAIRALCRWAVGISENARTELIIALHKLRLGRNAVSSVYSIISNLPLEGRRNKITKSVIADLATGNLELVIDAAKRCPMRLGHQGWYNDEAEIDALRSGNREELLARWTVHGISDYGSPRTESGYRLALFGIESPGGFQTWDVVSGKAERHNWLPAGLSVCVDTYGVLAPQPAANRLFVPYERSQQLRAVVSGACLSHAHQLWKIHQDSKDWRNWYVGFLTAWNSEDLRLALRQEAFQTLRNELGEASGLLRLSDRSLSAVASMHSEFGGIVFTRDLDGRYPFCDPNMPIPAEHIQEAAAKLALSGNQIEKTVESLSEFLGWDITKGRAESPRGYRQ